MKWQKFLRLFNGWLGFAVGSILFFAAPPLYRLIDPTAGSFDAGYIQAIIFAQISVSFAIGFSWLMLRFLAPGPYKIIDQWCDGNGLADEFRFDIVFGLGLFALFFISTIIIVHALV